MSIATVVTRGYGTFGTIADVVRRGYSGDADVADELRGRLVRRRRRRFWESKLAEADEPSAAVVAAERKMVQEMLLAAELDQLISEQKVLRGALDQAAKRQAKAINGMLASIEKRIVEIQDEDDEIITLLGG